MKVYAKKRSDRKKKWSVIQENEVTGQVKTIASFQFKKECDDFISNWGGDIKTNRYNDQNLTLAEFLEDSKEWLMNKYKKQNDGLKVIKQWEKNILPKLGHRPLGEISVQEWEQLFADMNTSQRLFMKDNHVHKKEVVKKVIRKSMVNAPSKDEFVKYLRSQVCLDPQKHRKRCLSNCYEQKAKICYCTTETTTKYPMDEQGRYILCDEITIAELSQITGINKLTIKNWLNKDVNSFPTSENWRKIYPHLNYKKYLIDTFDLVEHEIELNKTIGKNILDQPYKRETIRKTQTIIKTLYSRAVQLDIIKVPTINATQLPHQERSIQSEEKPVWTMEQIDLFLNSIKNDREYFAYYLYAKKGLRRAELPAIRIGRDIKFIDDGAIIYIRKQMTDTPVTGKTEYEEISIKTAKSKDDYDIIFLNIEETQLLREHIDLMANEQVDDNYKGIIDYLFSKADGSLYSYDYFYNKFKRILKNELKYDLPEIRLHGLRHSLATHYAGSGKTREDVQILMRHGTYKTTEQFYIQDTDDNKIKSWKRLDDNTKERKLV